ADGRLGGDVSYDQAVSTAGEATIGDETDGIAKPLADDGARRRQHLAHAGAALRPLVAHHHDVSGLDAVVEDGGEALLLTVEDPRWSGHHRLLQASGLGNGSLWR